MGVAMATTVSRPVERSNVTQVARRVQGLGHDTA
jgi:hypothetical protein